MRLLPRLPIIALISLLSLTPVWPVSAQILLPDIGDPARSYLSSSDEYRLGLQVMRRIREKGVIIDDVQLNEYLASIGQRIGTYAQNDGHPFTFVWIGEPTINAFAAPGGFISFNSGLLMATQTEDELAGVAAHEIAHVSQKHIVRLYAEASRMSLPMAAAMLAAVALAASTGGQIGSAALAGTMAASAQYQINFTRANEQEADRIGTQLLAQAGFDPNGMASFFSRLERNSSGVAGQIPELLLTHPRASSRLADTQDRVARPAGPRKPRDSRNYHLAKARMLVLTSSDNADLIRHYVTLLAKGDAENETAARYGYALALKRAGRYNEAQEQIVRLRKTDRDSLAFRIEDAEIALLQGDTGRGWRLFEETKELYPEDFTLAMHYGYALVTQGDARKGMQLLQPHLRRRPNDISLYAVYAQAAERVGDIVTTHATLAEYYYLNGQIKQAVEQAELGLKKAGASGYQQAQLQARLRKFKEEEKELASR